MNKICMKSYFVLILISSQHMASFISQDDPRVVQYLKRSFEVARYISSLSYEKKKKTYEDINEEPNDEQVMK